MKNLALIPMIMSAATPAFAQTCTLGEDHQDNRVSVTVSKGAVMISLHETSFTASGPELAKNGNTIAILDRNLKVSSEGETFKAKVSALLVYDAAEKKMNATLMIDDTVHTAAADMKCD